MIVVAASAFGAPVAQVFQALLVETLEHPQLLRQKLVSSGRQPLQSVDLLA